MKNWKPLLLGMFLGVFLVFIATIVYLYNKNKYNSTAIKIEESVAKAEDARNGIETSPKKPSINGRYIKNGAIYIDAEYFERYGDDAVGNSFSLKFYEQKIIGDFNRYSPRLEKALYIEKHETSVYDIKDRMHYTPISDLTPINLDSLTKKTIYLKNRFTKVMDKEISEHIALEVSPNKTVKITYLNGSQRTGICVPMYIKNQPTMMFFVFDYANGFLMKTKEGWIGKIRDIDFTSKNFEENTIFLDEDINALKKLKAHNKPLYYNNEGYAIKEHQIFDKVFNNPLLKTAMDTIYTVVDNDNNQLIVGEKANKKYLFNGLLQDITPKNFKAISNTKNFTVLADNKVSYITDRGKLHLNNIIKEEQFIYTYKIEENNTNMFSINCKFYENDNLLENYTSTPLKKPDSIEDIYFVNNKKQISNFLIHTDAKQNYLITKQNGLFGLHKFDDIITEYYDDRIKEIITETNLTALLPNKYTHMYAEDMSKFIYFEKDGLKGYYPIQKNGKYIKLEPFINNTFARFTLPNGRNGWLQSNGKEYLD